MNYSLSVPTTASGQSEGSKSKLAPKSKIQLKKRSENDRWIKLIRSSSMSKKQLSSSPKPAAQRDRFVCSYTTGFSTVFDLEGWPKSFLIWAKFNSTWHTADHPLLWTAPALRAAWNRHLKRKKQSHISVSWFPNTHGLSHTNAHTHPSRASAFLKTLTHPEEWNPEDANTVTLVAHLRGKSWEVELAIKDAVDAAGWGRERKRLWTPDWSQIGSTIDSTVWYLASGWSLCVQTQKHTLVYSYTHISNLTCFKTCAQCEHYSSQYNTDIYSICIDTHTQVVARGRQTSSGSGACDDPHTQKHTHIL